MSLQFVLYSVFELFTQLKRVLKVVHFWKQALKKPKNNLNFIDTTQRSSGNRTQDHLLTAALWNHRLLVTELVF